MVKNILKTLPLILVMVVLAGCKTSNYAVRGYMEDKPRVDQDLGGNSGYLMGKTGEDQDRKKTRKVIVMEVTKKPEVDKEIVEQTTTTIKETSEGSSLQAAGRTSSDGSEIVIPKIETVYPHSQSGLASIGEFTEYKVEKDDTLQKISKKFYDSYSKWLKIYEANKDLIKDPDNIKPGITIKIPKL